MSLTNLSLAGNNRIIPGAWLVACIPTRDGKIPFLFYSVGTVLVVFITWVFQCLKTTSTHLRLNRLAKKFLFMWLISIEIAQVARRRRLKLQRTKTPQRSQLRSRRSTYGRRRRIPERRKPMAESQKLVPKNRKSARKRDGGKSLWQGRGNWTSQAVLIRGNLRIKK
jgi:hypothetical protein